MSTAATATQTHAAPTHAAPTHAAPTNLTPTHVRLSNVLGNAVSGRHAARVYDANQTIDKLIARAHAPEPGDDQAAMAAADLLALEGEYSIAQFAYDCLTAIEIRNLRAADDAAEAERAALWQEHVKIRKEIDAMFNQRPQPNDFRPINRRLLEARSRIEALDAAHDSRSANFRELIKTAGRVLRALKASGLDVSPR